MLVVSKLSRHLSAPYLSAFLFVSRFIDEIIKEEQVKHMQMSGSSINNDL